MFHAGKLVGLSRRSEIIILAILGVVYTMFDASLLDLNMNMAKLWKIKLDPKLFSKSVEIYMKYLVASVILIQTFSSHVYLSSYIILLYPAIYKERPSLIIPWLVVCSIKNLFAGFLTLSAGFFTCYKYSFSEPVCYEFFLFQTLEHASSIYMFQNVYQYYKDLRELHKTPILIDPKEIQARRRKARAFDDERQLISTSTLENVLTHFKTNEFKEASRSLDALLTKIKDDKERKELLGSEEEINDSNLFLQKPSKVSDKVNPEELKKDNARFNPKIIRSNTLKFNSSKLDAEKYNELIPSETEVRTILPLDEAERSEILSQESNMLETIIEETRTVGTNTDNIVSKKRTSPRTTLTHPTEIKAPYSKTSLSKMEGQTNNIPVTAIYKNQMSYQSSYQDDGYTQAFLEQIGKGSSRMNKK